MNRKISFLLGAILVMNTSLQARTQQLKAPDFTVSSQIKGEHLEILAASPPSHHFNIKAPIYLGQSHNKKVFKHSEANEHEIHFQIPANSAGRYLIEIYLCDDAKSFCEKHSQVIEWDPKNQHLVNQAGEPKNGKPNAVSQHTENGVKKDHLGFIMNNPKEALEEAKKLNKPLLIDFFGIWCPPCNELDEEVFSSPEFQNQSLRFVKLKLDADSDVSWDLKAKYKIGGYPTILFASSTGDEISRLEGFRNRRIFLKHMDEAWNSRNHRLAKQASPEESSPVGKALETIDQKEKLAAQYQTQGKTDQQKQTLNELILLAQDLIAKPSSQLEDHDTTHADLWQTVADAFEHLGDSKKATEAWNQAVKEYKNRIKTGDERGYHLEMAYCLWKSGKFEEAENIYRTFEQKYPDEFTFYFYHASMKMAQSRYADAEIIAAKALQYSYGDNRLRSGHLLASAMKGQGKRAQAKELIQKTLSEVKIPKDPGIRTHRYLKQIQDLSQELNTEKKA